MSEKKQLNEEQLEKVSGGTYESENGYVLYTMEEIRKLPRGIWVYVYESKNGCLSQMRMAQFQGFNNKGYPKFHGSYTFTVGDNERYFVGPGTCDE